MQLRPYTDADRELTEALETDPRVMRHLGGPIDRDAVETIHRRRLEVAAAGPWWLVIEPEPGGPAAGTIGIWDAEHEGEPIHETGWTVRPEFQGRGLAGAALAELIERARREPRFERIHAFPNVDNAASNALCRKHGFELLGEIDIEFRGAALRCNHWVLGLL